MPRRFRSHAGALAALAVALILAMAAPASAHTSLVSSDPPPGAAIDALDGLTLTFDGPVDVAALHLWLEDGAGFVDLGAGVHPGSDLAVVRIALPPLGDGDYAVGWHLISADGDAATGGIPFTLGARSPGALATPTPAPAPPAPVASTAPTPVDAPSIAVAVAAVAIGLTVALARAGRTVRRRGGWLVAPMCVLGIAGCAAVALAMPLASPIALVGGVAALVAVFAAAVPRPVRGTRLVRVRPKEHLAR